MKNINHKYIKSYNNFINEKKKVDDLECLLELDFLKKYLVSDDIEVNLDDDKNKLFLIIPSQYITFDLSDSDDVAWKELEIEFNEFCTKNGLYDPIVTTTDNDEDLVFSAETVLVDTRKYNKK